MAIASYLQRRTGRYYLQIRLSAAPSRMFGKTIYRKSLGTSSYREAQLRLSEILGWFHKMNHSVDYPHLIGLNLIQLREYLQDSWPLSHERLFARRAYEEMFKNFKHKAIAAGHDPAMVAPEINTLFASFVQQNADAETHQQNIIRQQHYERGRQDALAKLAQTNTPTSFQKGMPTIQVVTSQDFQPVPPPDLVATETYFDPPLSAPEKFIPPDTPERHVSSNELASLQASERQIKQELRFSEALAIYQEKAPAGEEAKNLTGLIVTFLIDKMGDLPISGFGADKVANLDAMIPDIPNRKGIPKAHTESLAKRYDYAQKFGWENLTRLTVARIQNGYHNELSKFFGWLIDEGYYLHDKPIFKALSPQNLTSLPRDSFDDEEVIKIFSQPLFNGCSSDKRIWKPGTYYIQNHLYWAYLMLLLTGVRPGELGQLELDDIKERDGIFYLHLRPFDPSKGRVAIGDVKRFKTESSQRIIPLHPLLLDLGLEERIEQLRDIECPVLFPEWEPYYKPNASVRWGQPITKSWQYVKKNIGIEREDVTLYSTRHWFADLIDNTDIKHVTRKRVMGHKIKDDTPARYGSKTRLTTRDLALLTDIKSSVIDEISGPLIVAKEKSERGELMVLKPWLQHRNWSQHYQSKLLGK